jgi:fumarylacetoacetase
LKALFDIGFFKEVVSEDVFEKEFLNDFIQQGKLKTSKIRAILQNELILENSLLAKDFDLYFHHIESVKLHLPIQIGGYTDFYSNKYHADNVGRLFRKDESPLTDNWLHMPIAYHGRASSVVVSGTEISRPYGQMIKDGKVIFGASEKVDFELEFATVIGKSNLLGNPIEINDADDYIFGFCLLNDWSARDIQSWEYRPLGPFLGKNFATTISPWIVTLEALEPFKVPSVKQKELLSYLHLEQPTSFDINLKVYFNDAEITNTNFSKMYWTIHQQIAHHTVNGCNLQVGDILGSGTISDEKEKGSLLEQTFNGQKPLVIKGENRTFIENGDTISLSGYAENNGLKVGFGHAVGTLKKRENNE